MRYANAVPFLVNEFELSAWATGEHDKSARAARMCYYNVYSVPWRSAEILDIYTKQTGRRDLTGQRVLDLGCGMASMDLYFVLEGHARVAVAVDRNITLLETMHRALDRM